MPHARQTAPLYTAGPLQPTHSSPALCLNQLPLQTGPAGTAPEHLQI